MKTMKLMKYFLLLLATVSVVACSEDKMDQIDSNPNAPTNVAADLMVTQVVTESAFGTTGTDLAWYASVFCEYNAGVFGQLQSADQRSSVANSTLFNNNWNSLYTNLYDLKVIIGKCSTGGEDEGNTITLGIAQTLMAYNLGVATDVWGQIPYSEALQPDAYSKPSFDKQSSIYNSIQALLNEAIVSLSASTVKTGPGARDLIYGGDPSMWIKAAWALKARYYNHLSKVRPDLQDSVLICTSHAFADNSESCTFNAFQNTSIGSNPWYQFYQDRNYLAISSTFYNLLTSLGDPRLDYYADKIGGVIKPAPIGVATSDQSGTVYSRPSANVQGPTTPISLIDYKEVKFLEAEVYFRKGLAHDAYLAFEAAVTASFDEIGMPGAAAYIATLHDEANLTLTDILTQKYISGYEAGALEAYVDVRRTDIPVMMNPNNATAGFVRRYPYTSEEISANPTNIPDITPFQRLWWDGGND